MDEINSLQDLYDRLLEVTQNELELTELLPYEPDVVELILMQITNLNDKISRLQIRGHEPFEVEHHKIESERFSYLINTYLRTRVRKIEENAPYLKKMRDQDRQRARKFMSRSEREYLDNYYEIINSYMKNVLQDYMPPNMQKFNFKDLVEKVQTDYAFVIGKDHGTVADGNAEITIEPDICRILTVSTIVDQLEKGSRLFKLI